MDADTTLMRFREHDPTVPTGQDGLRSISQNSRLFEIPPELRNNIYTLVLTETSDIIIPESAKLAPPSLLRVCRQIRHEAIKLYYAENSFRVFVRDDARSAPLQWAEAIRRESSSIVKAVNVEYHSSPLGTADSPTLKQLLADNNETTSRLRSSGAHAEELAKAHHGFRQQMAHYSMPWLAWVLRLYRQGIPTHALHFPAPQAQPSADVEMERWDVMAATMWRETLGVAVRSEVVASMQDDKHLDSYILMAESWEGKLWDDDA